MNPVHLHLMLTHLPVVGTPFVLLLLLVGLARKSEELKRVALGFFVLLALAALPAYLTGEPTEDRIEKIAGISKPLIERHEGAAQWAFSAQVALGVAALGGLFFSRRGAPLPAWCAHTMIALALAVSALMAFTASLGGEIRHLEIRTGSIPAQQRHR